MVRKKGLYATTVGLNSLSMCACTCTIQYFEFENEIKKLKLKVTAEFCDLTPPFLFGSEIYIAGFSKNSTILPQPCVTARYV